MIHAVRSRRPGQAPVVPPPAPGRLDPESCFRWCEAVARAHHENFPRASVFLPPRLRPHVLALYAFVRTADDIADEPRFQGRRAEELDRMENDLGRAWHGEADHPLFVALAETATRCELPITPLSDLLAAFRQDLSIKRYATWRELEAYLDLAAKPIGRLLLWVFGDRDPDHHRYAEELACSLALTNFWQDLATDLSRDRIYLPAEDLKHFGVTDKELADRQQSPGLEALVRATCARTRARFERARPLMDLVSDDLGVEVALFWYGGSRALDKIASAADDVFGPRRTLSHVDKALVVSQALARRGAGLVSRL